MVDKYPCVFSTTFLKEQVDARLYELDKKTPFGAFRKIWKEEHCSRINPYGSESCPFTSEDCSMAFYQVAKRALLNNDTRNQRVGFFRKDARWTGIERSENKPGLRGGPEQGPFHVLGREGGMGAGQQPAERLDDRGAVGLRRAAPRSIGSLLRGDGTGPRLGASWRDEGKAPADDHGNTGDPVSPPPSRRLGDQPPRRTQGVHQESE